MSGPRHAVLLDTDPGVGIPGTDADDPIALLLALAHPALELVGVTTTFGNCPPALGARGAAAVLESVGRTDVPVVAGRAAPLSGTLPGVLARAYAGERGRPGRIELPAVTGRTDAAEFIVETVRARPGEVTVVAIGPQTNLAAALALDPGLAADLRSVVFMGGALGLDPQYGRGNITPVAECNIYFDPQAADAVLRSGLDLTMVGLDVTSPRTGLVLTEEAIRSVDPAASPGAALFAEICRTYLDAPMFDWGHGCVLYDPLAVLAAAEPAVGTYRDLAVRVDTSGTSEQGRTVLEAGGHANVRVMVDVDGAAAVDRILQLITDLTAAPVQPRPTEEGTS
ncbi:MAG TPA: nucleoside hydrolase [Cellulomonas sp.]